MELPGCASEHGVKPPERVTNTCRTLPPALDGVVVARELGPEHLEMEPWFWAQGGVGLQEDGAMVGHLGRERLKEAGRVLLFPIKRRKRTVEFNERRAISFVTPSVCAAVQIDVLKFQCLDGAPE